MRLSSGKSSIRELEFIAKKKKKPERDRQAQNMTALYIASYSGLSICRYTLLCWAWTRRLQRIIGRYLSRSSLPQSSAWHEEETAWRFFFFFFILFFNRDPSPGYESSRSGLSDACAHTSDKPERRATAESMSSATCLTWVHCPHRKRGSQGCAAVSALLRRLLNRQIRNTCDRQIRNTCGQSRHAYNSARCTTHGPSCIPLATTLFVLAGLGVCFNGCQRGAQECRESPAACSAAEWRQHESI